MPLARAKKNGKPGWAIHNPVTENRPLYRLPEVNAASGAQQVIVVEGEKCADAMLHAFPRAVVTTWAHGTNSWKKTDWTPLYGREVLLAADADDAGRACMRELGDMLAANGCKVRVALPPGTDGHDVADEIEEGGAAQTGAWLGRHAQAHAPLVEPGLTDDPDMAPKKRRRKKKSAEEPPPPDGGDQPPPLDDASLGDNEHFTILGNEDSMIVAKLASDQIMRIGRTMITRPNQLFALAADVHWWLKLTGAETLSQLMCWHLGTALIRIADARGQIDMNRMTGRGVRLTEDGKYVWHLGNKLLVDGAEVPLKSYQGEHDTSIYLSAPAVHLGGEDEVLPHDIKEEIAETVLKYRWATPQDGKTMLGWIVTSIAGGALQWRPHIWFLGDTDLGKSWFIREVMMRIQNSLAIRLASPSEASIARRLRSDSLPVIIDEAEPDQSWLPGVVTLARIAAAGDGERSRADGGGEGFSSFSPRFSVCMSSTKLPRLDAADNNRFCLVQLSEATETNWLELEPQLLKLFSPPSDMPRLLRTTIIHQTAGIAERAQQITREIQRQERTRKSRQAMLRGALSAGWQWWSGTDEVLDIQFPTPAAADQADAALVLNDLMSIRVRQEHGRELTLLELLAAAGTEPDTVRYGMAKAKDGLLIAPKHAELKKMLNGGKWREVDAARLLCQLPGAVRHENPRRFSGLMRVRGAICLPYETMQRLGFMLQYGQTEAEQGNLDDGF